MKIIHVASELAPVAKVGGLGDVLFGLSAALAKECEIEVFLPKYDSLEIDKIADLEIIQTNFPSYFEGAWHNNHIWKGSVNGFKVLFFESNDPHGFFERGKIYGSPDDPERFLYFSRLVLEYISKSPSPPDIIHVHDWHASAIPLLKKELFPSLHSIKTMLTIHNLSYQGITDASALKKIGLSTHSTVNLLKEGIIHADQITTVSPTYAKEALTPEYGMGLEDTLFTNRHKFEGILNGIDEHYWNPATDSYLQHPFSSEELQIAPPFVKNKEKMKEALCKRVSASSSRYPLVGCVTRLVTQKGLELIKEALYYTLDAGGQFFLLGTASEKGIHDEFYDIKRRFSKNSSLHIELSYNEPLSHLIYAGCDLLVIPSLFEPCGLTQMIAMRYGTLPLVRETGGLADTVFEGVNGFTFKPYLAKAMEETLQRAFNTWIEHPAKWHSLMKKAMTLDYSWSRSAKKYFELYTRLLADLVFRKNR